MKQRQLGKTGMTVSELGYGAFKIGRNQQHHFEDDYELPDEAGSAWLLNQVLDAGITLIDTAPAYGFSEERIGRAIGHRRDDYVLATKVGEEFSSNGSMFDYSSIAVRATVAKSLQRLRTDCLDVVCVHSDGNDLDVQRQTDVVETLLDLRRSGDVLAVGFSAKTADGARLALDWADVLMVTYSLADPTFTDVIADAARTGVGIIVKKGLSSGRLAPAEGIPFVLDHPGVSSMLIGSLSWPHLRQDLAIAEGRTL